MWHIALAKKSFKPLWKENIALYRNEQWFFSTLNMFWLSYFDILLEEQKIIPFNLSYSNKNTFCYNVIDIFSPNEEKLKNKTAFSFMTSNETLKYFAKQPHYLVDNFFFTNNEMPIEYDWVFYIPVYEIDTPFENIKDIWNTIQSSKGEQVKQLETIKWWRVVFYTYVKNENYDKDNENNQEAIFHWLKYTWTIEIDIPDFDKHIINHSLRHFFYWFVFMCYSPLITNLPFKKSKIINNRVLYFLRKTNKSLWFVIQFASEKCIKKYLWLKQYDDVSNQPLTLLHFKQNWLKKWLNISDYVSFDFYQRRNYLDTMIFKCSIHDNNNSYLWITMYFKTLENNITLNDWSISKIKTKEIFIRNNSIAWWKETNFTWSFSLEHEMNMYSFYSRGIDSFVLNNKLSSIFVKKWEYHFSNEDVFFGQSKNRHVDFTFFFNVFNKLFHYYTHYRNSNLFGKTILFNDNYEPILNNHLNDIKRKDNFNHPNYALYSTYFSPYETWYFTHLTSFFNIVPITNKSPCNNYIFENCKWYIGDKNRKIANLNGYYAWTINQKWKYGTCYDGLFLYKNNLTDLQ